VGGCTGSIPFAGGRLSAGTGPNAKPFWSRRAVSLSQDFSAPAHVKHSDSAVAVTLPPLSRIAPPFLNAHGGSRRRIALQRAIHDRLIDLSLFEQRPPLSRRFAGIDQRFADFHENLRVAGI